MVISMSAERSLVCALGLSSLYPREAIITPIVEAKIMDESPLPILNSALWNKIQDRKMSQKYKDNTKLSL
jgi:hypothetical protein